VLTLPGYQILAQIHESANTLVYRGIREQDSQPVILKLHKEDYPTPSELARYKQEYEITRNLNLNGVVKAYSLERYQNTLVIIFEDFGASSLTTLMNDRKFTLSEFLSIAIKIAESLGEIHAANIIHKDIKPSNIFFNPQKNQVKIIDFGISSVLTRENPTIKNPNVLEGSLAYISPEQTGRMNRSLDYRTDFYSLGATFYELLTYQLPFDTTDAMELVHSHIAKQPIPPHEINPEIPKAVSDIVMKLLAKTAEERYQSAWGLKSDLQECLTQLQNNGQIAEFPLGRQDISDKFQIPQKLYGREQEVEILMNAFERVSQPPLSKGGQGQPLLDKGKQGESK
jgi:serine/threonine protein kinase